MFTKNYTYSKFTTLETSEERMFEIYQLEKMVSATGKSTSKNGHLTNFEPVQLNRSWTKGSWKSWYGEGGGGGGSTF